MDKQKPVDDLLCIDIAKSIPNRQKIEEDKKNFIKYYLLSKFRFDVETKENIHIYFITMDIKELCSFIGDIVLEYEKCDKNQ